MRVEPSSTSMSVRRRRRHSVTLQATSTVDARRRQPARQQRGAQLWNVSARQRIVVWPAAQFAGRHGPAAARHGGAPPAARGTCRTSAARRRHARTQAVCVSTCAARGARARRPAVHMRAVLCSTAWCPAATAAARRTHVPSDGARDRAWLWSSSARARYDSSARGARRSVRAVPAHLLAFKKTAAVAHLRT